MSESWERQPCLWARSAIVGQTYQHTEPYLRTPGIYMSSRAFKHIHVLTGRFCSTEVSCQSGGPVPCLSPPCCVTNRNHRFGFLQVEPGSGASAKSSSPVHGNFRRLPGFFLLAPCLPCIVINPTSALVPSDKILHPSTLVCPPSPLSHHINTLARPHLRDCNVTLSCIFRTHTQPHVTTPLSPTAPT